jgi:hypothetical protein
MNDVTLWEASILTIEGYALSSFTSRSPYCRSSLYSLLIIINIHPVSLRFYITIGGQLWTVEISLLMYYCLQPASSDGWDLFIYLYWFWTFRGLCMTQHVRTGHEPSPVCPS